MTWLKMDDGAMTHPRSMHLRALRDPIARPCSVVGWVGLAASVSGQHDTDGFIAEGAGVMADQEYWELFAEFALKVGIIRKPTAAERKANNGQPGWMVVMGKGEIFHLLTRAEKEQNKEGREARGFIRRKHGRMEVLLRDGDQCRYCGQTVDELDKRGGRGRTFDHPDPAVPDVVVVACRKCNSSKGKRTVDEWVADGGLQLLPPPAERGAELYLNDRTREWLSTHALPEDLARAGIDPVAVAGDVAADQARNGSSSGADAASQRSGSDLDLTPTRVTGSVAPGRARNGSGSGQVGSSAVDPSRRRSRARGSRGGRRGRPPTPEHERSA